MDSMTSKNDKDYVLYNTEMKALQKFLVHDCVFKRRTMKIRFGNDSGIGISIHLSCDCGENKDITDYSCW